MNLLMLLMLLALPIQASAQTAEWFLPRTADARSTAMGRTSIASPGGSNTLFYNPAGLATLTDMQFQASGQLFFGESNENVDFTREDFEDYTETANYAPHLKLSPLSFSLPYQFSNPDFRLAFGLGYQTYYDFGMKITMTDEEDELMDKVTGGLNTLSPAVALSIQDRFFVGLSFNKSIFGTIAEEVEVNGEDIDEMELKTSGSFWMLGGLARLSPSLTVGLMYRPSFEWEWEIEEGSIGDLIPGIGGGLSADLEYPALFGVGVAYRASPSVLLVGEYQTRPFSKYEVQGAEIFEIDDGASFRLGAEFGEDTPVRVGVFRDAILEREEENDNPLSLLGLTGGIGFVLGNVELDTAMEFARWSQNFENENVAIDLSENHFRIRLSARYRFSELPGWASRHNTESPPSGSSSDLSPAEEEHSER